MSEKKREKMNEEEFDIMLEKSLSDAPPRSIVDEITPWKKAMNRVLIGLVLSTVSLNFFCLEYILPTFGAFLMFFGFRAVRNDNRYFKASFVMSALSLACLIQQLILRTVPFDSTNVIPNVETALVAFKAVLMIGELFCLWRALVKVKEEANEPKKATPAFVLLICYAVICVLTLINFDYSIAVIVLLILYLVTVFCVYRFSKELDKAGYVVEPSCVKVSDKWIALAVTLVLTVGLTLGYIFGGGYDMKWENADASVTSDVQEIKDNLISLGFPKNVLDDLTADEISSLGEASRVVSEVSKQSLAGGELEKGDLTVTTVAIKAKNEKEKWTLIHHFAWRNGTEFCGTHSLQLWPAYQYDDGWISNGETTGRVLCEIDGEAFTAPYYRLESKTHTTGGFFSETSTDTFAAFSLPKHAENCRGYVMYSIVGNGEEDFFSSWLNYTYQVHTLQYPVRSAYEQRLLSSENKVGVFRTQQYSFLYNPNRDKEE